MSFVMQFFVFEDSAAHYEVGMSSDVLSDAVIDNVSA